MSRQVTISVSDISIGYPKTRKKKKSTLYDHLSVKLYAGELTCLLGANGVGKSTLLRTLSALQAPLLGDIQLLGKKISSYSESDRSKLLGLVLTDRITAGGLTVVELVGLGRYPYTGFFGMLNDKDHQLIHKAMEDVDIVHKANSYIAELSDGERQKVMIAKALAQECPIIILDEPTAFLDVANRIEVTNLLHHLAVEQNKSILLSTHDIELALLLADRLWLLEKERGLICGVTEDIVLSDAIGKYLGKEEVLFDKNSGRFYSKPSITHRELAVQSTPDLMYWVKNFLHRKGYGIALFDDCADKLFVNSPSDITLILDGSQSHFISFEELDIYLDKREAIF